MPSKSIKNQNNNFIRFFAVITLSFNLCSAISQAQEMTAATVRKLYAKYPSQKTDFCAPCKLWVNPHFKTIADTLEHRPMVTFYIYTKQKRIQQESLNLPRTGTYAKWNSVPGMPSEDKIYREANRIVDQAHKPGEIQKGHCQPWILLAYSAESAVLSNTYTYNSAMQYRGQNTGTQIASEELCRALTGYKNKVTITDSVKVWCGTYGSQRIFNYQGVQATVPSHYYKIIQYFDKIRNEKILLCYWLPNQPDETRSKLKDRQISLQVLVAFLGFNPQQIFVGE